MENTNYTTALAMRKRAWHYIINAKTDATLEQAVELINEVYTNLYYIQRDMGRKVKKQKLSVAQAKKFQELYSEAA